MKIKSDMSLLSRIERAWTIPYLRDFWNVALRDSLYDRCSIVYVVYIRLTFRYHFIVIPIFRSANPIICLPIYLSIYLPIYLSFSDYESHRPSANWAFSLKRISEAAQKHRLVFKDWVLKMGTPPLPPSMRSITLISLKRYELPTNRVLGY